MRERGVHKALVNTAIDLGVEGVVAWRATQNARDLCLGHPQFDAFEDCEVYVAANAQKSRDWDQYYPQK